MILVDTSVWVNHLRVGESRLAALLGEGQVMVHPFIVGEIALGNLRQRKRVLSALRDLPCGVQAGEEEVLRFIETHALQGTGIGYVDAHLLASARLSSVLLWTQDKRLRMVAVALGLSYSG